MTDASYVQFANEGIATLDIGFPMRYSHSSREICNLNDLIDLKNLLVSAISRLITNLNYKDNKCQKNSLLVLM